MEPELVAFGIQLSVLLLVLPLARGLILVPASVALLRQQLFGLRRRLFLLAADGHLSFNDPAYTRLRMTINSGLRFAERYTLPRMLLTASLLKHTAHAFEDQLDELVKETDAEVRVELERIRLGVGAAILGHLTRTSVSAIILTLCAPLAIRSRKIERSAEALSLADETRAAA